MTSRAFDQEKRLGLFKKNSEHLNEVDESYLEHASFAFKGGLRLIMLGLVSFAHGIFPGVWKFKTPEGVLKIALILKYKHPQLFKRIIEEEKTD